MKRENKQTQRPRLLISVDRIRRLTSGDMRGAVGGHGHDPIPCSHSVNLGTL